MNRFRRTPLFASMLTLIGVGVAGMFVSAADSPTAVAIERSPDPMQEVTPEREAAAEVFARRHHPELAELLKSLKAGGIADYDNAVRDLFRESERLAKLKARDPERYGLELDAWKVSSRIQLATARLAMDDSPELRAELLNLLKSKLSIRMEVLKLDRDKTAARLTKLDSDLAALRADPAGLAAEDLERLLRSARSRANQAARNRQSSRNKSAAQSTTGTTTGEAGNVSAPQTPREPTAPAAAASKN